MLDALLWCSVVVIHEIMLHRSMSFFGWVPWVTVLLNIWYCMSILGLLTASIADLYPLLHFRIYSPARVRNGVSTTEQSTFCTEWQVPLCLNAILRRLRF